jgi:hypothetical protein
MDRCRTDLPPLAELRETGGRLAACWLQDGPVPAELALPVPVPGAGRSAAVPGARLDARPATADVASPS